MFFRTRWLLLIFALALSGTARAGFDKSSLRLLQPGVCENLLTENLKRQLQPFRSSDFNLNIRDNAFEIDSRRSGGITAGGRLLRNGILELTIYTRAEFGPARIPELRGKHAFDMILEYFGDRVQGIRGRWRYGDNLIAFNKYSATMPLEAAATKTWTGRQAARYGFTEVHIEHTKGIPGAIKDAEVLFLRPTN